MAQLQFSSWNIYTKFQSLGAKKSIFSRRNYHPLCSPSVFSLPDILVSRWCWFALIRSSRRGYLLLFLFGALLGKSVCNETQLMNKCLDQALHNSARGELSPKSVNRTVSQAASPCPCLGLGPGLCSCHVTCGGCSGDLKTWRTFGWPYPRLHWKPVTQSMEV